jgi:3-oxoacyl-[acyl-carrier protein] reductase
VADEEQITSVINEILKEAGEVDVLVNNAGITRDNLLVPHEFQRLA